MDKNLPQKTEIMIRLVATVQLFTSGHGGTAHVIRRISTGNIITCQRARMQQGSIGLHGTVITTPSNQQL